MASQRSVARPANGAFHEETQSTQEDRSSSYFDLSIYLTAMWLIETLSYCFVYMVAQVTDSGSNNFTMAREMHRQFSLPEDVPEINSDATGTSSRSGSGSYSWDPKKDHARCFLHKLSSTVKEGLKELGQTAPTRDVIREAKLGAFPIPNSLPTICEEEDEGEADENEVITIPEDGEVADGEINAPDDDETDHDSEDDDENIAAPDYDEDEEDEIDQTPAGGIFADLDFDENAPSALLKTAASRKNALKLNALVKKVSPFFFSFVANLACSAHALIILAVLTYLDFVFPVRHTSSHVVLHVQHRGDVTFSVLLR